MIFTNDKGDVLHDISNIRSIYCDKRSCAECDIDKSRERYSCRKWVQEHQEKAAHLMGWEVMEEEPDNFRKKEKSQVPNNAREAILESARLCVCGDRDNIYGGPEDSFQAIAGAWEWYLKDKCCTGDVCLLPEDVGNMMALFKIARIKTAQKFHPDNYVDAVGYMACAAEIAGKGEEAE